MVRPNLVRGREARPSRYRCGVAAAHPIGRPRRFRPRPHRRRADTTRSTQLWPSVTGWPLRRSRPRPHQRAASAHSARLRADRVPGCIRPADARASVRAYEPPCQPLPEARSRSPPSVHRNRCAARLTRVSRRARATSVAVAVPTRHASTCQGPPQATPLRDGFTLTAAPRSRHRRSDGLDPPQRSILSRIARDHPGIAPERGNATVNRQPAPTFSAPIRPRCASTMPRAMARPRPAPPSGSGVRAGAPR